MSKMKILKVFITVILALVMFSACWDSSTDNGDDEGNGEETKTDVLKSERLTASADSVVAAMMTAGVSGAEMQDMTDYMETAGQLYEDAAAADPSNSQANFGAALFSFQLLLEHPDMKLVQETLEEWVEDVENLDYSKYYVTQYFMFGQSEFEIGDEWGSWEEDIDPFDALMTMMYFVQNSLTKTDMISLLQDIIDTSLIGSLDKSIANIDKVLTDKDFIFDLSSFMTAGDDGFELDLGEVYMVSASMRMLRGSLKIINAYQYSIPGVTGNADLSDMTTVLPLIKSQDENGGNFLKLRSLSILPSAKKDLTDALTMIESGVTFIKNETDDQFNDLIKQQDLTEADQEINSEFTQYSSDMPVPALRGAKGIVDMAQKIKTMLDGPFDIEMETGNGVETISLDISAFLNNGIPDIKNVLPYHEWCDLNSLPLEFDGPGIEGWTTSIYGEEYTMFWLNVLEVYNQAKGGEVWDYCEYSGSVSKDGVFTVRGKFDWDSGKLIEFEAGAELTTDGAFYLDPQKRLCITEEAYNTLNSYIKSLPRNSWIIFDLADEAGSFIKYNFSLDHPYGVRDTTGVFKFAGVPEYSFGADVEPVYLVDKQGSESEFPVFPDPTFGGLFPGMTQERFESFASEE